MIALITDFGTKDNFTGVVKGVIKGINPKAEIIDITHNIAPQDINEAAFSLVTAYRYFAPGTIFLCVVDPTVGTHRDAVIVKTKDHYFIAPDNGLLSFVLDYEHPEKIISVTNEKYYLPEVSQTFHARDIFAPVAGHLSRDLKKICDFGEEKSDIVRLKFSRLMYEDPIITADVIHVDRFGNVCTNIDGINFKSILLENDFILEAGHARIKNLSSHYAENEGGFSALFASSGFLEISKYMGNAAVLLGLKAGDKIKVTIL